MCRWRVAMEKRYPAARSPVSARSTWFSDKQSASGGVSNFISTGCIGCRCWLGLVVWICIWCPGDRVLYRSPCRVPQGISKATISDCLSIDFWRVTDESLMSLEMSGDHLCYGCVWAWDVSMYTPKSPSNPAKMMKQDEILKHIETLWFSDILSGFSLGFPMVSLEFSRQTWRSLGKKLGHFAQGPDDRRPQHWNAGNGHQEGLPHGCGNAAATQTCRISMDFC